MPTQFWLIALSNTLHLLATVIWIGWSITLPLLIAPRAEVAHRRDGGWVAELNRRVPPLAYGALALLGATGMLQMGAHPQYEGVFEIANLWSRLLLLKHILIGFSVILILVVGLDVSPRLRLAQQRAALGKEHDSTTLTTLFRVLVWGNALVGLGVLISTGLMTAIHS